MLAPPLAPSDWLRANESEGCIFFHTESLNAALLGHLNRTLLMLLVTDFPTMITENVCCKQKPIVNEWRSKNGKNGKNNLFQLGTVHPLLQDGYPPTANLVAPLSGLRGGVHAVLEWHRYDSPVVLFAPDRDKLHLYLIRIVKWPHIIPTFNLGRGLKSHKKWNHLYAVPLRYTLCILPT